MKKVELSFLAVAAAFLLTPLAWGYSVGGESGWQYRTPVHIDHTKVGSTLANFPVLVALTSSDFDFSHARSDGYDIRFTSNIDGTGVLKYERERHDNTNSLAEYWVKIPSLSNSSDTYFYMFYGNPTASDGQDKTNVWDTNFKMVQHLHETSGTHYDSTSNGNNGTCYGGVSQNAAGKIDGADDFDGTDDYVEVSDDLTLDITDAITLEAWANGTGAPTGTTTKGTPHDFDTTYGGTPALWKVDDSHHLCAYTGAEIYTAGVAMILTVSTGTGTITSGTAHQFDTIGFTPALSKVDDTHYMCAYRGGGADGWAVILTVDTGEWSVSSGTPHEFDSGRGSEPALSRVDDTHYLCAYSGPATNGYAMILTVDTSFWTITSGTAHEFDAAYSSEPALSKVDDTHYLCAYTGTQSDGYAVILTVDTASWTVSSDPSKKHEFDTADGYEPALSKVDDTHFLCAYRGTDDDGFALILTVDTGTGTITSGTAHEFDGADGYTPALSKIDDTHFLCAYRGSAFDGHGAILTLDTSTWTITSGPAYEFDAADGLEPALSEIDNTHYLCAYRGTGDDGYAVMLNVEWGPIVWKGSDGYSIRIDGGIGADSIFTVTGFINDHCVTAYTGGGLYQHIALTYDKSNMRLYIDGSEQDTLSYTSPISTNAQNLKIGNKVDYIIDEVRVSDTARNAAWIWACYNNQNSPSTFCILGTETLAAIARLDVRGLDSEVVLEWETDAEVDTAGFNVLRAEAADGPWVKLNENLIPSQGSSWEGASYAFSDESREAGTVYWYCVEEVNTGGGTERYPAQLVWDEGLTDADRDQMPDVWEQRLGIDTGSGADANADADGDGATNLEEYLAGTSPLTLRIARDFASKVGREQVGSF